uniref:Lectin, mannose binding 2 like n=1 Tax=Molossus molossus TaxID=27622 RepID=A0A7J8E2I8_MOLMO|nr:lectin, mannose binding 2 like [Molossus molossus]
MCFSLQPCFLRDWELQVHFKIHGQGKKNLHGDGLAIWYTKDRMQSGPVFGNMDKFVGLGVFVDTYPNEEKQQESAHDLVQPTSYYVYPQGNTGKMLATSNAPEKRFRLGYLNQDKIVQSHIVSLAVVLGFQFR